MSEETQKKETKTKPSSKIAVLLVRGLVGVKSDVKDTLFLLRLRKKHVCVIVDNNETNIGMLRKVKDYVTYGEVTDETIKLLETKRGKKDEAGKLKPFFELAPPKGGFEKKGIKKSFNQGGVLGLRGEKINDLLIKMI